MDDSQPGIETALPRTEVAQKALPPLSAAGTLLLPFRYHGIQSFFAIFAVNTVLSVASGFFAATRLGIPCALFLLAIMFALYLQYSVRTYSVAVGLEDDIVVFRPPERTFLRSWLLPGFSLMLLYVTAALLVVWLTREFVPDDAPLRVIVAYLAFGLLLVPFPAALLLSVKRVFGMLAIHTHLRVIRAAGFAWLLPYLVGLAAFLAPLPVVAFVHPTANSATLELVHGIGLTASIWLYGATGASVGWLARRNPEVRRLLES